MIVPLKPLGLNVSPPVTPVPLHEPVIPLYVVLRVTELSIEHKGEGLVKGTTVGALTLIIVVLLLAH